MKNINPTQTQAWKELEEHFKEVGQFHMRDLFREDPGRADKFSIEWEDFYVDFSKNRFDQKAQSLLLKLAEECGLEEAIDSYFKGDAINRTENRAVLHTALRSLPDAEVMVGAENVIPEVESVKKKIKEFTDEVISGARKGHTGKAFTDVVNIGIGGSDLGPTMVTDCLTFYQNHLNLHFISNVDGDHVHEKLKISTRKPLFLSLFPKLLPHLKP